MVKQGLRWEKLKSAGDRILWVRVEGIGCVGAVYLRQQGGASQQLICRIVRLLALDAKEFLKTEQVIVAGDFNARVGAAKRGGGD